MQRQAARAIIDIISPDLSGVLMPDSIYESMMQELNNPGGGNVYIHPGNNSDIDEIIRRREEELVYDATSDVTVGNVFIDLMHKHKSSILELEEIESEASSIEDYYPQSSKLSEKNEIMMELINEHKHELKSAFGEYERVSNKIQDIKRQHEKVQQWLLMVAGDMDAFKDVIDCSNVHTYLSGYIQELRHNTNYNTLQIELASIQRKCEKLANISIGIKSASKLPLCAMCMDKIVDTVFECGHTSCRGCSTKVMQCPVCRSRPLCAKHLYIL